MAVFIVTSCALVALVIMHVRSIRVPKGLAEPRKYRFLMASLVVPRLFEQLYILYHRGNFFAKIRARRLVIESLESAPPETVKGSNIRSTVIEMDGVRVRLYEPIKRKEGLHPCIVFMHGGGMATGSPDSYDGLTRHLAERLQIFVASIDYRLAPEHPFPAGYQDNLRAVTWLLKNGHTLGIDAHRVAVMGDSAGGNFAAGMSQAIHDDPIVPNIKLQILLYPGLHQLDFRSHSYQKYEAEFGDDGPLNRRRIGDFIAMYLHGKVDPDLVHRTTYNGHISQYHADKSPVLNYVNRNVIPEHMRLPEKHVKLAEEMNACNGCEKVWGQMEEYFLDPRFAPLVREDLRGLPKAMITTCGFDCLRDDGIYYAQRLRDAGVDVHYKNYESGFHGVIWISRTVQFKVGKEMLNDVVEFITNNI